MSSDHHGIPPTPRRKLPLRTCILALFLLLTVPVMFTIILVDYRSNEALARQNAAELVERFRKDAIANVLSELDPIESLVRATAELANAQPDFFNSSRSHKYLRSLLTHNETLTSIYVGLENGAFRQARSIDPTIPINGQTPPTEASSADRYIEGARRPGGSREDEYVFLESRFEIVGRTSSPTTYDPRIRPWYKAAVEARRPTITDPEVFATLGLFGFSVAAPFYRDGRIAGVAAADITLDGLSRYLDTYRISQTTLAFILDQNGRIIANSDLARTWAERGGKVELQHVTDLPGGLADAAWGARRVADGKTYGFTFGGKDYLASLSTIPDKAEKHWQLFVITPIDDFADEMQRNNLRLLVFGLIASLLQILVIYSLSRVVSAPLEKLAGRVDRIRQLQQVEAVEASSSVVREIATLSRAIDTMDTTVKSFASFVPVGLVNQLLETGQKLAPGGNSRFLTIFFSDLESFSTLSEELPTQELLNKVSAYLDVVTRVTNAEAGTIDKFIGDGVMAFWGAPALLEDHAWRACVAALRIQREMNALNATWAERGEKPLRVRIGIHSDAVVVGNIGSAERLSYTVMGDGVNIASRLEGVNKDYGTRICISHTVFKEVGERLCVRPIDEVAVKGRRSKIPIYELVGAYGAGPDLEPDEAARRQCELTRAAYAALIREDRGAALLRYEALLTEFPDDTVAATLAARLRAA